MDTELTSRKRPIGVWIIVCLFALSYCLAIPAMIYTINNHPEALSQFSVFEIAASILSMAVTLVAIVLLFQLKAISFWILLGVGLFSAIPLGVRLISGQEIPVPEETGYGGQIFEVVVWVVIMIYIWALKSKGILK